MNAPPQTVLITGCNRGLGLEFVRQLATLASSPSCIIATCRKPDNAVALRKISNKYPFVHILQLEVTDRENIKKLKEQVRDILQGRGLNLLINNAGVGPGGDLYDVTEEIMMNTFKINVVAPLLITQAFLPFLKTAAKTTEGIGLSWRKAAVVNISSRLASIETNDEFLVGRYSYKTSKAALNMVSKNLGVDLREDCILALSLSPGSVRTDMGVPSAPLLPHQSVEMMLQVMAGLNEDDSGAFLNFTGELIPW
ncbi:C-signal-like [Ylistrum balloti]|uniref:C-signal-like n=1 Tax=Ylistrum balloti TaxID=509963 RepID=UPI002905C73A|nr:C-signal-like [Ylistrum balloti]